MLKLGSQSLLTATSTIIGEPCSRLLSTKGCYKQLPLVVFNKNPQTSIFKRRRHIHNCFPLQQQRDPEAQVHALGDFYADLLAVPIPRDSEARKSLPSFVDTGGDATKEERAAKLFGSIKGSGYERKSSQTPDATWQTINGVPVPPRPDEPDNCCMSGCVHCVWDDYRDDLEEWAMRLKQAQLKASDNNNKEAPKVTMARSEVSDASSSMDDDGGGSESLWDTPNSAGTTEDLFAGIPVGIREFMATEKRIRNRKIAKQSKFEGTG